MYYLKHIWVKIRYSAFLRLIFDGLTMIGIRISLFYIVLEGLFDENLLNIEKGFNGYDVGYLGAEDMKELSVIPGPDRSFSEEDLLLRLKQGNKCLGIKYKGRIAAFTWFDLGEFKLGFFRFSLKENEAYLFDAYTLMSFRGKGLAPYMRYRSYKELAKLGKNKLYSVSECFNTPSIRFKMKLNAKIIELYLYVEIFKKWHTQS